MLFSQQNAPISFGPGYIITSSSTSAESETLQNAVSLLQEQNYKKALKIAKRMGKKHPEKEVWYYVQAIANTNLGEHKKVEENFQRAFKNLPASSLLYYNYAIKKKKDGNFFDADQFMQQSIQLDPSFPQAHLALSRIQELQGNRIKAILPLYVYFLFLPNEQRDTAAFLKLKQLLYKGIKQTAANGLTFTLPFSKEESSHEMLEMELFLNELNVSYDPEDSLRGQKLLVFTEGIFSFLQESGQVEQDIWFSFYADILGSISSKKLTRAFLLLKMSDSDQMNSIRGILKQDELDAYGKWRGNL